MASVTPFSIIARHKYKLREEARRYESRERKPARRSGAGHEHIAHGVEKDEAHEEGGIPRPALA